MRAVMLDVPEYLLKERNRLGLDRRDEMWEGVLHMVPPPSLKHQEVALAIAAALRPIARAGGLRMVLEAGAYQGDRNWRVPDILIFKPEQATDRGVEQGAEIVFELKSPHDETYEKIPFYEAMGVGEMFVIHPDTCRVELYLLRNRKLLPAVPDASGVLRSEILGVGLAERDGGLVLIRGSEETLIE